MRWLWLPLEVGGVCQCGVLIFERRIGLGFLRVALSAIVQISGVLTGFPWALKCRSLYVGVGVGMLSVIVQMNDRALGASVCFA